MFAAEVTRTSLSKFTSVKLEKERGIEDHINSAIQKEIFLSRAWSEDNPQGFEGRLRIFRRIVGSVQRILGFGFNESVASMTICSRNDPSLFSGEDVSGFTTKGEWVRQKWALRAKAYYLQNLFEYLSLSSPCQCLHACILSSTINENLRPPSIIGLACRVGSIMSIHDSHTQWMLVEVEQPETHRFFDEPPCALEFYALVNDYSPMRRGEAREEKTGYVERVAPRSINGAKVASRQISSSCSFITGVILEWLSRV
ncbi:hypothetical protein LENED_004362 [Lentinula edodes]|uniref:Uncharacterized protein n=1 Tax=Lentinula edodes TaxID=5353 RepID=A0A1Q3E630_LENED|nr:hypothetical protein LENED_004362 [Lentinula edodes]